MRWLLAASERGEALAQTGRSLISRWILWLSLIGVPLTAGAASAENGLETPDYVAFPSYDPEGCLSGDLKARELVIVVDLHESYLLFEQSWSFSGAEGCRREGTRPAVSIPLPEGALGVHVIHPADPGLSAVSSGEVQYFGESGGERGLAVDLVYRFSLPNNDPSHRFVQRLGTDVQRLAIVVPRETDFARHPRLSVDLEVPYCDSNESSRVVCFPRQQPSELAERYFPWLERSLAFDGRGSAGEWIVFDTRGWPAPSKTGERIALIGLGLVILCGLVLLFGGRLRGRRWSQVAADVQEMG